jgi:hypothetical protein
VLQWTDWGYADAGNTDTFSMQAILYHTSYEIVFQIGAGDSSQGAGATFGVQSKHADHAVQYGCNKPSAVPGGTTICIFEPRFPAAGPVLDLEASVTNKLDLLVPSSKPRYLVEVTNHGPAAAYGSLLEIDVTGPMDCTWSCAATPGSSCTGAPGTGDFKDDELDLRAVGSASYEAVCALAAGYTGHVSVSARVSAPALFSDPQPDNNQALDRDLVGDTLELFSDGFESGDLSAWSVAGL